MNIIQKREQCERAIQQHLDNEFNKSDNAMKGRTTVKETLEPLENCARHVQMSAYRRAKCTHILSLK